ncbi:hypothetical protein [Leptospira sp. 'Mane']|uniref:hypothetical protein n=1 Tax=Leptospira sp. 'Mane' TaxID=3387407 RepID=UPI00398B754D
MNKQTKLQFKGYYEPTPHLFRKIGDTLLAISAMVTGYAIAEENKIIAYIFLGIGVVGKALSNFFSESSPEETMTEEPSKEGKDE